MRLYTFKDEFLEMALATHDWKDVEGKISLQVLSLSLMMMMMVVVIMMMTTTTMMMIMRRRRMI